MLAKKPEDVLQTTGQRSILVASLLIRRENNRVIAFHIKTKNSPQIPSSFYLMRCMFCEKKGRRGTMRYDEEDKACLCMFVPVCFYKIQHKMMRLLSHSLIK